MLLFDNSKNGDSVADLRGEDTGRINQFCLATKIFVQFTIHTPNQCVLRSRYLFTTCSLSYHPA